MTLLNKILGKYSIWVKCTNCEQTQETDIVKGVTIDEFLDSPAARCVFCGCNTLVKDHIKY